MRSRCDACRIEFEPKTKAIATKENRYYHHGCWAKINKAMILDLGPEELLFMREPLTNEVRDGMVTFRVKHD